MISKFPYWRQCLLVGSAMLFWALGTCAYFAIYASYPIVDCGADAESVTAAHNSFEVFVRAIWGALSLFAFSIDSNAVDGWLEVAGNASHWPVWMLSAAALGAGMWTINFAMQLLLNSCKAWFRRYRNSGRHYDSLYIFWGINRRSLKLAEDINKEDAKGYCVFVVNPAADNEESHGVEHLLDDSKKRSELQKQIGSVRGSILVTKQPISDAEIDENTWKKMGIRLMERYIQHANRIHVLLLGDDENANIYDALRMDNEVLWGDSEKYKHVTVHCLARRSSANRVMEDVTSRSVIEIVDSSHLAIELLKQDPQNHPVRFVNTHDGVVYSPFRSLIIGFSECGQDALRFLYEFSALVSKDSLADKEADTRSPFYCDIVDKQLDASAARWRHHAQGMFTKQNSDQSPCITFHPVDYQSPDFYTRVLDPIIKELNYIVIAVGDDKAGITLAVDILQYAIKSGRVASLQSDDNPEKKFRIYVRSYDPNMYDYIKTIAAYYNEQTEFISIFGAEQEVYTMNIMIAETLKQKAMEYQYNYHKAANKHFDWEKRPIAENKEKDWEDRRTEVFGKKTMEGIQNLRRMESQDFANALHIETKKYLKSYGATPLRLAQTEHLRWEAAHEIMGYSSYCPNGKSKDILHYGHSNMVPWKELDGDSREYDFLTFSELYSKEALDKAINEAKI